MMQTPKDEDYGALLSGYMSPAADGGFGDALLAQIEAEQKRVSLYRRLSLYGAAFVGGIIAAVQLPKLVGLIGSSAINTPELSLPNVDMALLSPNLAAAMIIVFVGFALWVVLDQRVLA